MSISRSGDTTISGNFGLPSNSWAARIRKDEQLYAECGRGVEKFIARQNLQAIPEMLEYIKGHDADSPAVKMCNAYGRIMAGFFPLRELNTYEMMLSRSAFGEAKKLCRDIPDDLKGHFDGTFRLLDELGVFNPVGWDINSIGGQGGGSQDLFRELADDNIPLFSSKASDICAQIAIRLEVAAAAGRGR